MISIQNITSEKVREYWVFAVTEEEAAKLNDVQVVGFGFIALAIISGIISWVVKRLLDDYFVSGDLDAE